jgi:hypothetical protein
MGLDSLDSCERGRVYIHIWDRLLLVYRDLLGSQVLDILARNEHWSSLLWKVNRLWLHLCWSSSSLWCSFLVRFYLSLRLVLSLTSLIGWLFLLRLLKRGSLWLSWSESRLEWIWRTRDVIKVASELIFLILSVLLALLFGLGVFFGNKGWGVLQTLLDAIKTTFEEGLWLINLLLGRLWFLPFLTFGVILVAKCCCIQLTKVLI